MAVRFASLSAIILVSTCLLIQLKYQYGHLGTLQMVVLDSPTAEPWRGVKSLSIGADNLPAGCFPSDTHKQLYNRSLPVFRTEEELMTNRPRNFHRMLGFDDDEMVSQGSLGGIVDFRNAYVLSENQISFNCDIVYVPHGCKAEDISDKEIFSLLASPVGYVNNVSFSPARVEKLDTVIVIAQFWGYGYYHALIEDLPRLALVLDILEADPEAVILSYPLSLMYPTSRPWLLNKLLGLGNDRKWVPFDDHKVYFAKKLIIPTATRCGHGQPMALRLVRDKITANTPIVLNETLERFWLQYPGTRLGQRTIIIVQKRSTRSLLNHDDLLRALKTAFADCCTVIEFLGTEPMENYIVMHHQAKVIVGPHGAGLSNILFAQPNAALVEIHPKVGNSLNGQVNECHQSTARSLGLESRMLVQESGESYPSSFEVDVQSVIDTVRELLQSLRSSKP